MSNEQCDVCGRKLRKGARYGVDKATPACATEYHARWRNANRERLNERMRGYMRARRGGAR